jgi:phospholipid transport system substrate-binding protein
MRAAEREKRMRKRRLIKNAGITITFLIMAMVAGVGGASAGPPTEALKASVDEVVRVLNEPELSKPEKKQERRKVLVDVISKRFNFEEMAKRTVGAEWAKRTPEERREFVDSFRTLLSNSYLGRIENYSGEKVHYYKEITDGEYAEVRTEINTGQSTIPIDYKMENAGGDWRVYDVVVEGTGLVSNYREQFKRILRKESFEALSKTIREKAAIITAPGAAPPRRAAD